jgi:dienelactone hydrolase
VKPTCRPFRSLFSLLLLASPTLPSAAQTAPPPVFGEIVPTQCLALDPVGRSGRGPLHSDRLENEFVLGRLVEPKAGDRVARVDGTDAVWTSLTADKDGVFRARALQGGYAAVTVQSPKEQVMLLEASGDSMCYVNGTPRTGDPYSLGYTHLPVLLRAGSNTLIFSVGRGELRVKLTPPTSPVLLETDDTTLPDLIVHEKTATWGALVLINASNRTLEAGNLTVRADGRNAGTIKTPSVPPLATRKIAFPLNGPPPATAGEEKVEVRVHYPALRGRRGEVGLEARGAAAAFMVRVRNQGETYKRTFRSEIDGSVQYYGVNPAHPLTPKDPAPALVLSLHGAGVEGIGQADAYESKTWATLVAPTNRRPYGFDWEDWGRLDAMEVLGLAQRSLKTDPQRTYLTGHSMGGHGTWHVGVTFPDRFAAIGPSAGWISLWSYAGATRTANPSPMQQFLNRSMNPSDTLALKQNYAQEGVYVIHGAADDNVPVTQAREMVQQLSTFHKDTTYFEQPGAGHWWDASDEPGADCVDWQPLFEFFAHHALAAEAMVRQVDFTTADPGVSAWCHWAGIVGQAHRLSPSSVRIRLDPGQRRFLGVTDNVALLALRCSNLPVSGALKVELDGQTLADLPYPTAADKILWLTRKGRTWSVGAAPALTDKRPERCGPFKQAFRNRMVFVYGTQGTPEENAWALAKARYDAETFWYRGNGSVDVVADNAFDANRDRERSVILYGNADTNAAWKLLLADSPVQVGRAHVTAGAQSLTGEDLACLFVRPRPGSVGASVGVVGGSGLIGMRLTDRLPYFVSGVEYPDYLVLNPDTLTAGLSGVRLAGFFGSDWTISTGEFLTGP